MTHYADADAPGRYLVRALCGAIIRRDAHAETPTCPACRRYLAARENDYREMP